MKRTKNTSTSSKSEAIPKIKRYPDCVQTRPDRVQTRPDRVQTRPDNFQVHSDAFQTWLEKYQVLERQIIAERDRREANRQKRRENRNRELARAFGDFCEATEGRAVIWREEGFRSIEMAFQIATDVWTRKTAERYFNLSGRTFLGYPLSGALCSEHVLSRKSSSRCSISERSLSGWMRFNRISSVILFLNFLLSAESGVQLGCYALHLLGDWATQWVNLLKQRAARPLYYEQETARRRALAADRRRIQKRTTVNTCPTKEAVLEAYLHRKDSKETALYFGSLIHDLECYVDNSLLMFEGRITGRNAGIKGWLRENIPVLADKYTTVMRYKAAAKKLKQLIELDDPFPAETVLVGHETDPDESVFRQTIPDEQTVRAVAIYRELAEGVTGATQMIEKIDAFLDPNHVEETNMLNIWRTRYQNEITVRNKSKWWGRLTGKRVEKGARRVLGVARRPDLGETARSRRDGPI